MAAPSSAQPQHTWQCREVQDLAYPSSAAETTSASPSRFHKLDLFVCSPAPSAAAAAAPAASRPLLVFIHGGLWVESVKIEERAASVSLRVSYGSLRLIALSCCCCAASFSRDKAAYAPLATHWVRTLSVHVCVVNYTLSTAGGAGVLHPTHTDDVLRALQWVLSPGTQRAQSFATEDVFLVGHSCGAHIAGLITLAERQATLLTDLAPLLPSADAGAAAAPTSFLQLLRGCVGVEGIYDCARFSDDFPSWSSGISDAFGTDASRWESPQDYLPLPPAAADEQQSSAVSASRSRVQGLLASSARPTRPALPWLVIHSKEDPWVNLPQAERFHAALLLRPASSELLLVSGEHFVVVECVGTELDELTKPIGAFVQRCLHAQTQSSHVHARP